ncbi:MAG: BamA/OMP85 family outer membrane protein, partial [Bacteroidota bacterium]
MKTTVNVDEPKEYEVGGIRVSNIKYLDAKNLKDMSGISVGDNIKVPGDKIQTAIKNYWNQELFSDVEIRADSIVNNLVYLEIYLQEHLRLNKYKITGIKKSEKKDLLEKLKLKQGKEINENVLNNIRLTIHDFFLEKGYSQTTIDIKQVEASENNYVNLNININKNERIKIKNIIIKGNETFSDFRLERKMKDTKEKNIWNLFNSSKYIKEDFEDDQDKLISFYNKNGYRDARIDSISIKNISDKFLQITITIDEGNKYYFGEIDWVGNTKYSAEILDKMLGIQKGDVYDQELLEKRLFQAEDAITSLYLDNGYLFSNIEPVVGGINNDSINYKMRIFEGKQARINKIIIIGNTKTNEHVIRRELRTMPGELFSKSDIIRSIRELSQLGFF